MEVNGKMKMNISEKERLAWGYSFKSSKRWLNAIMVDMSGSKHTERGYIRGLYTFCQWIKKTPDQLIMERNEEVKNVERKHNAEDKVRDFCLWLEKTRNITRSTIVTKYHAVLKSFYNYNDVPLNLRTPKYVMRKRSPHTTDEVKTLMKIADIRERAIIMVLKDSGMSREDVVKLTYGDIKAEFEKQEDFIHIRTLRRKESLEYDTFIGKNAVEYLKAYLDYRKRRGHQINEGSPLLATLSGKPLTPDTLSMIFARLTKKVGFKTSPHRFRKYFESHLGLSVPSILVRYWLGHSLGVEGHYFLPPIEKQREKYIEGYREINIFKVEVSEFERRKQQLLDIGKMMYANKPEKLQLLEVLTAQTETMEDLERIPEQIEHPKLKRWTTTEDDCQKIINESEIVEWIGKGFHFVAVLPSGKILVSNE